MAASGRDGQWRADGKFFRSGDRRVLVRAVTYGPFPGGWAADLLPDFRRIAAAGFNAVRLYEMPPRRLLDAAQACGLRVFAGLMWRQACDFITRPAALSAARVALSNGLRECRGHPALAAVYVGNEVPSDLVRWMGPVRVRRAIEELIAAGRNQAPELMFAYANYPSTEYLEPENADFTAMNVFLESEPLFRSYLGRLHHIAGDRPVMISEFGLDSRRNGPDAQARALAWAARAAALEGAAGFTVYAWSDRWWNAGGEVLDWDFGLTDRAGAAKPALAALAAAAAEVPQAAGAATGVSVVVCTRNGGGRIGACLAALRRQRHPDFEVIVVDDGSTDDTSGVVARGFPGVTLLRLQPGGLGRARNTGAAAATRDVIAFTDDDCEPDEDWLANLARGFAAGWDAVGGPNLAPPPADLVAAVIAAAPGAPSHVMLDDQEAEHLPGCNLAVRASALAAVGGFDEVFVTAGDDVDFCWRLQDAGFRLGFSPTAFVWHHRRGSLRGYLNQQLGYGKAEALLIARHRHRFTPSGDAVWHGFVYGGGPVRAVEGSVIYHGPMGMAGYQGVVDRMQPRRPLAAEHDRAWSRFLLRMMERLQPRLRTFARIGRWRGDLRPTRTGASPAPDDEFAIPSATGRSREHFLGDLLVDGWRGGGPVDGWDVEKEGTRLLLATEHGDKLNKRTLVRRWGPPRPLPPSMAGVAGDLKPSAARDAE
jgi:GT2 family glycosyltransferase